MKRYCLLSVKSLMIWTSNQYVIIGIFSVRLCTYSVRLCTYMGVICDCDKMCTELVNSCFGGVYYLGAD